MLGWRRREIHPADVHPVCSRLEWPYRFSSGNVQHEVLSLVRDGFSNEGRWSFIARQSWAKVNVMRCAFLFGLWVMFGAAPALAESAVDEGPLSPCIPSQSDSGAADDQPAYAWGIELASAFSKDEALSEFDRVKQDHPDLLGSYEPMLVESCDLHLGTALRYSARIGMDSRDAADALCAKLQAAGAACIVLKN